MNPTTLTLSFAPVADLIRAALRLENEIGHTQHDGDGYAENELRKMAKAFYLAIPSQVNPPLAVRRAIMLKFFDDLNLGIRTLANLNFDAANGCYWFGYAGMYHGVEPDGYIHT